MSQPRRNHRLWQVFIAFAIVAFAVFIAVTMTGLNKTAERKPGVYSSPKVTVKPVSLQDKVIDIHTRGLVSARTRMPLVPEVSGKVVWVSDKWVNGGFFLKDELMLSIEKQKYRHQVADAKSRLLQASSQLIQEEGAAYVAKKEWEGRLKALDKAAGQLALRKPQLASARAQVESATEALASARLDLEKTDIKAPYDGLLSNKQVDIGQFLGTGQQMAEFNAIDFVEIRVPLSQKQVNLMALPEMGVVSDLPVRIFSESGSRQHEWTGTLVRTEGLIDKETRVLFAVIEVKDPYGIKEKTTLPLRIGAFVEVVMDSRALQNIVTLPRRLLRTGNNLWLVNDKDELEKRKVDILPTRGQTIFVYKGLTAGDRVVTTSMADPVEGRKVTVDVLTDDRLAGQQP